MARYQTLKWKFYVIAYYITFFIRRLILRHLTLFDWKFLQIGTIRAKDLKKKSIQITKWKIEPCPARTARNKGSCTTMVLQSVKSFNSPTVYFRHRNFEYKITDIGGQISERRKWIQYFGKAEAILFVTALSDYDEMSINCRCRNQLTESMQLFKIVLTWFKKSSCVLFLNKKDLFKEKIMESHLGTDHLPESL